MGLGTGIDVGTRLVKHSTLVIAMSIKTNDFLFRLSAISACNIEKLGIGPGNEATVSTYLVSLVVPCQPDIIFHY